MTKVYDAMNDADMFSDFRKFGKQDENNTYFSPIFLFSNDEMDTILRNMDFEDGLLSVTASLDHALNAILLGAKDVTLFDINKAAKYFAELKLHAIKNLDYEEFLHLYGLEPVKFPKFQKKNVKILKENNSVKLNKDMVYKLCKDMNKPYSYFFERLFFLNFFDNEKNQINFHKNIMPNANLYMKKDEFYKLKELLNDVKINEYIDCDIFDLKKHISDNEYSAMIFSNITSYFVKDDYKKLHRRIEQVFSICDEFDFSKQIELVLLFFVYNAVGDIVSTSQLCKHDKLQKCRIILSEDRVRQMFSNIKILNLPIPLKLKILTLMYKYKIGIKYLIAKAN